MPIIVPKRVDLIRMFPDAIGVEVGVCKGHFSIEMLNHAYLRKLYCVDAWEGNTPGEPPTLPEQHEANFAEARHHTRGHRGRGEFIRGRSTDVAHNWSYGLVDFVYIDASHDFDSVLADLVAWAPHVRLGGSLLGHDYTDQGMAKEYNFGVIPAVTKFCQEHNWKLTHLTEENFPSYRLDREDVL